MDAAETTSCWSAYEGSGGLESVPSTTFSQVDAYEDIACGIAAADGHLECWGWMKLESCDAAKLGCDPNPECRQYLDYFMDPPAGSYVDVTVGSDKWACAIRDDLTVVCWGDVFQYVDENGTPVSGPYPPQPEGDPLNTIPVDVTFLNIDAGKAHVCGLTIDGAIQCWGDDSLGQVSDAP